MDYRHLCNSVILKGRGLSFLVHTYAKVFKCILAARTTPGRSNNIKATQHQNCSLWQEAEIMESSWKCLVHHTQVVHCKLFHAPWSSKHYREWTYLWTQRPHSLWTHWPYWYLLSNVYKYSCARKIWDEKIALWFCPSIILLRNIAITLLQMYMYEFKTSK